MNTYLRSKDKAELEKFCQDFTNHIGTKQGIAAHSYIDLNGETIAVPASGDPEYYYAIVTTNMPYTFPFNGVEECDPVECMSVCGGC